MIGVESPVERVVLVPELRFSGVKGVQADVASSHNAVAATMCIAVRPNR